METLAGIIFVVMYMVIVSEKIHRTVAAIASAPSARKDGKSMISTGVAHHRGESAIAIKASRNSDNGHWSSNVNGAADTRGQWTVGAGVGYEW